MGAGFAEWVICQVCVTLSNLIYVNTSIHMCSFQSLKQSLILGLEYILLEKFSDSKHHSACFIHEASETHRKTCLLRGSFLRFKKWS